MAEQDNLTFITKGFEDVNAGNLDLFIQKLTPEFRFFIVQKPKALDKTGVMMGVSKFKDLLMALFNIMPDCQFDTVSLTANGNMALHVMKIKGTHEGTLSLPNGITCLPTNRGVEFQIELFHNFGPSGEYINVTIYINPIEALAKFEGG